MSVRRPSLVLALLVGCWWFGAACSCGDGDAAGGSGGAATDAASEDVSLDGSEGGKEAGADADAGVTCFGGPKSSVIPAGWKRFPGLPCDCDVWYAPDESQMSPAPAWTTTAPGVLEMENNWADYAHRFLMGTALGDSWQGKQYLAYLRDLGNKDQEAVVVVLPENKTVFQARIPGGGGNATCNIRIHGLGQGTVLHEGWHSPGTIADLHVLGKRTPPGADPVLFYTTEEGIAPYAFGVSSSIAAWVVGPGRIDAFGLDGGSVYKGAWSSKGPPLANNSTILAWDDALFFDVSYAIDAHEAWVWDAQSGARALTPLTGSDAGQVGSSYALGTDGKVMVWTQASGSTGSGWQSIDLMIAPYTTDPAKLTPKKLRSLPALSENARWKVQGGFVGTDLWVGGAKYPDVVLVRLSDGAMWTVPKRSGRYFGAPLYITDSELALEEAYTLPNDAGITEFESWSIVRYPIALLGPGTPP